MPKAHNTQYVIQCIKTNEGSLSVMSMVVNLVNEMLFLSYLGQYREARLKIIEGERNEDRQREGGRESVLFS